MNKILIIFSTFIILSCATLYKPINHERILYEKYTEYDSITFSYKPEALIGNYRYNKKASRNNFNFISLKIHNKSDKELIIGQDLLIYNNEEKVNQVSENIVFENTLQLSALYLLYMLRFSVRLTSYNGNSGYIGISPLGSAFGITNTIIAAISNKKYKDDIISNSIDNKIIEPHSIFNGLLILKTEEKLDLHIVNLTNQIVNTSTIDINEIIQLNNESDSTYELYLSRVENELKNYINIEEIKIEKVNQYNGELGYIGLKVKHNYNSRKSSWYQIGTWKYFYEDGKIKQTVQLDLMGKLYEDVIIYDRDGNKISYN